MRVCFCRADWIGMVTIAVTMSRKLRTRKSSFPFPSPAWTQVLQTSVPPGTTCYHLEFFSFNNSIICWSYQQKFTLTLSTLRPQDIQRKTTRGQQQQRQWSFLQRGEAKPRCGTLCCSTTIPTQSESVQKQNSGSNIAKKSTLFNSQQDSLNCNGSADSRTHLKPDVSL